MSIRKLPMHKLLRVDTHSTLVRHRGDVQQITLKESVRVVSPRVKRRTRWLLAEPSPFAKPR